MKQSLAEFKILQLKKIYKLANNYNDEKYH